MIWRGFSFVSWIQSRCCLRPNFLILLSSWAKLHQNCQNFVFSCCKRGQREIFCQLVQKMKICQNSLEYFVVVFSQSPQSHSKYPESQQSQILDGSQSANLCRCHNAGRQGYKARIRNPHFGSLKLKRSFNPQRFPPGRGQINKIRVHIGRDSGGFPLTHHPPTNHPPGSCRLQKSTSI